MNMMQTLANSLRVPEIRKKLAFTAAMLLLYRLGAYIPAPGVDINTVKSIESNFSGNSILGFLNLFSGGSLSRLSLFALGIMPYITASIILQLMTVVVPSLERLQKEGEVGQQKITQYTRYLTVALAFAQSVGYVFLFQSFQNQAGASVVGTLTFGKVFLIVISLTAGTTLLMWLGELITQRGIGNGISLMIFASIASRIPTGIEKWWTNPDQVFVVMMPFIALAVIVGIFTYFYTAVTFNPVDQADNLKKYGGFIPGVRPGRPTAEYLDRILSRLTFPGALYLGAVAALPTILISQTSANFFFGGTSILIVIGVALDTVKQLEAQLMMRNYEGFLK